MKKVLFTILVLLTAVTTSHAAFTYTYGPGTYFGAMSLDQNESMLVNGGGGGYLGLF